eukprot:CAMPEP_0178433806 /NCGR_PEP_ID=MMETSP0689_2-20121128/33098_1 /TAXON_ID=160604 /ORGANISM="Amphidinium massartii, Strain CS-259" /LENGTH=451 /DNA_ID=CAMNT_0020055851 /DNA_START=9 /DNA_END=1364 /DNA_ORIENTATION=+
MTEIKKSVSFHEDRDKEKDAKSKKPLIPKAPADGWKIPSRYEMTELIGTGSYGSVCKAFDSEGDEGRGQFVAIKRMQHMFDDLIDCKRILREVAIMSQLNHEFVVTLFNIPMPQDGIENFTELYVVMELCDTDLKKLCRTDVTLQPLHINTLLYNLLVGVLYVHSAGILHRDLKPANILCNQDCAIKICDFGLARAAPIGDSKPQELPDAPRESPGERDDATSPIVPSSLRTKRTLTGHVVTRWYRAPELILLQDNYNEAIDVWSVGCIYAELLNMLEGVRPADRGPLFPGSSCFPLSPDSRHSTDYKYHTKGKQDQLNMIFSMLGTPTEEEIDMLNRDDAKRYVKCFSSRKGSGIQAKFPHAPAESCDLVSRMLCFNPRARISVDEALKNPIFKEMRTPSIEKRAPHKITLDFDNGESLNDELLRKYFAIEIEKYKFGRPVKEEAVTWEL